MAMLLLLLACHAERPAAPDDGPTAPDDGVADAAEPAEVIAQCTETYAIPGPLGTTLEDAVTPHALVFGVPVPLGANPLSPTVGPDPSHVHLGWPGQDTSVSISFVWTTDDATHASLVQWGPAGEPPTETAGVSFAIGGTSGQLLRAHELKLCGRLQPDTTYTYRVGGGDHWSPTYTFRTPPPPGSFDTFVVAMAGDSRDAPEDFRALMNRVDGFDPDLILFSGDMVQTGTNLEQTWAWWEATGDILTRRVLVPAHGNHEYLSAAYFGQFSLPGNEQWFSLDFGNLTVASLNDTVADGDFIDDQAAFVREKLGASTAPWKLVLHHQSAYATCDNHGSNLKLRETWAPVNDEVGVDVAVNGHNHIYERSVPILGDGPTEDGGTTYLVTGGAGATLYPAYTPTWFSEQVQAREHYLIAAFDRDGATWTAYDRDDNVIDTWRMPITP